MCKNLPSIGTWKPNQRKTPVFAEYFNQSEPCGQTQQPAHKVAHDEICTAESMSLLRSRKGAAYSDNQSYARAPVLSRSLPSSLPFALKFSDCSLQIRSAPRTHTSQLFISSSFLDQIRGCRHRSAHGHIRHDGRLQDEKGGTMFARAHLVILGCGFCNPRYPQGASGRLVASSALCCNLRNQSSLITGCSRSVDGGEGLGLRDAARYEGGAVEPVSFRTRLFRATVLPVGFEVRCVDGIEIIEDELDDNGLSTVSISTSFSENSIRGSNDAVLLIFSGMRAIR
jgi:hypothetical protein